MSQESWTLEGYDTFEGAIYLLPGTHGSEDLAVEAAKRRLLELEESQPTSSSGGQSEQVIQDHVYVVRPDGTKFRVGGPATVHN